MTDGSERCSDVSRAAGEPLAGTAPFVEHWLLVEVRGGWTRDVGAGAGLPDPARARVEAWLADRTERRRLLFVRRPGRAAPPLAFLVRAQESSFEARRIELTSPADLADVDLEQAGEAIRGPLVLVCGHGSRDACCARRGTAVYERLVPTLADEDLWISSHHGGHRFAANVLLLPQGLHFGRVDPDEAREVVGRARDGHITLDRYRGRTCYRPRVQAAEHAIRTRRKLRAVSDLELAGVDDSIVRFRTADGSVHGVRVSEQEGPLVRPSCGEEPKVQPAWAVEPV
jgi:hypothetical protein